MNRLETLMIILHAIREANSEDEVYKLLNAYRESVGIDGELHDSSSQAIHSPITDVDAVARQVEVLASELQEASTRLDDGGRLFIKEVLHVFCAALEQLDLLSAVPRQRGVAIRSGKTPRLLPDGPG